MSANMGFTDQDAVRPPLRPTPCTRIAHPLTRHDLVAPQKLIAKFNDQTSLQQGLMALQRRNGMDQAKRIRPEVSQILAA